MDSLERLRQAGHVEPVDHAVLDAALQKLGEAIGHDERHVPTSSRAARRRTGLVVAAVSVAALITAATFAALSVLGDSGRSTRLAGSQGPAQSRLAPAASARPSDSISSGSPTIAAILTAFSASHNDVLMVTKTVVGEGTCCKSIIWISPAEPTPGATVHSRIQNFSLAGSRLADMGLSYTAPVAGAATAGGNCDAIFVRPKPVLPPATGVPGTFLEVNYPSRAWVEGDVHIQAATVPSAAALDACLKGGQWRDEGKSVLAGAKVIELMSSDGFQHLWVSAATFLPVRLVATTPRPPYAPVVITFAFRFLLPTAATQAMLTLPRVPAGFSKQALP